jgi:hypothetical protein
MTSQRALGVSNHRDMIYAYLGMVDVRDDCLAVNYDKSVAQVFDLPGFRTGRGNGGLNQKDAMQEFPQSP